MYPPHPYYHHHYPPRHPLPAGMHGEQTPSPRSDAERGVSPGGGGGDDDNKGNMIASMRKRHEDDNDNGRAQYQ